MRAQIVVKDYVRIARARSRETNVAESSGAFEQPGHQNMGATGGFQAGYNYQMGSLVPGFETDFDYLGNCRGGTFTAFALADYIA